MASTMPDQLVDRLALHAQRHDEGGDLGRAGRPVEDLRHRRRRAGSRRRARRPSSRVPRTTGQPPCSAKARSAMRGNATAGAQEARRRWRRMRRRSFSVAPPHTPSFSRPWRANSRQVSRTRALGAHHLGAVGLLIGGRVEDLGVQSAAGRVAAPSEFHGSGGCSSCRGRGRRSLRRAGAPMQTDRRLLPGALLAGFAAAQQRPHLVGGVPPMTARRAHRRDPAPPGPVRDRPLGHLEQQRDLAGAQQPPSHALGQHAVADAAPRATPLGPEPAPTACLGMVGAHTLRSRSVPDPGARATGRTPERTGTDPDRAGNLASPRRSSTRAPRRVAASELVA